MESHCLKHQGTVATARCGACSIPLCDLCVQLYDSGKYCGDACYQSVQEGKVRVARMAAQDEAIRKRRQTQTAIKTIVYIVLAGGLFFGWDSLPEAFTGQVESLWASVKGAFAKGK
jgi:hypothetical protein